MKFKVPVVFCSLIAMSTVFGLMGVAAQAFEPVEFVVSGDTQALEDHLRAASSLLAAERDGTVEPDDIFGAARVEYSSLINALYANGHYSGVVHVLIDGREAASIQPLDVPNQINRVQVSVEPGPAFHFSKAAVAPLAQGTEIPEAFAVGKPALSGLIKEAVTAGIDGWRAQGNAKAKVASQKVVADHAQNNLSAEVALAPGPRLRFGPLLITGQERMRENRIRKIAGLPEGVTFDPRLLAKSADRLRRTGVFKSVTLTEDEQITSPDLLRITATVVEEKLRRYSIGAEIGSSEGAKLTGYWLHRNLAGGGERLKIEGEVANIGGQAGGIDYTLGVTLDRPATFTPDTTLSFNFDAQHMDLEDFTIDGSDLGFTLSHYFSERLTAQVGLQYNFARVKTAGVQQDFKQLELPIGVTYDTRDVKLDAKKGLFLDAEVQPFLGFGFTDSGARITMDGRIYRSFGAVRPVTLAFRGQIGAVLGSSIERTPRDYLFFSGGGGTVRGQPYQSLGVDVLSAGGSTYTTGGMAFAAISAELRARVTNTIGIVGFVDAGSVGALDFFDSAGGWHAGAGLGVRYDTGFGPIRLDVATPVGGDTGDGVQIYIGIGQSF